MKVLYINDYEIFHRLKSGDLAAFDIIYHRYWDPLYRLNYKILKNRAVCEDIVQDTFIKFWEKRETIENINLLGYLSTISYRMLLKTLENEQRKRQFLLTVAHTDNISFADADQHLNLSELQKTLSSHIKDLPPQSKIIYHLSREQNMPVKEIALHLGLRPKTVENQITIALTRLRRGVAHLLPIIFSFLHF